MILFLRICGVLSLMAALLLLGVIHEGMIAVMAIFGFTASAALFFCVAGLTERIGYLENMLHVSYDKTLNDPELPKKKCAGCGREIDFDYVICPHCGKNCSQYGKNTET